MMINNNHQDRLLDAISDPDKAKIIGDIWDKLENSPIEAVKMVRKWEEVKRIIEQIADAIPKKWAEVETQMDSTVLKRTQIVEDLRDFRQSTIQEFSQLCDSLKTVHAALSLVDENCLNKLNRICDLLERLRKSKQDGTFELLTKLK